MAQSEALDVIQRCYAAFGRGDMDGLTAMLDPAVTWRSAGPPELPSAGTWQGPGEVARFFATIAQLFDIVRFEPQTFLADGERVVVLGEETIIVRASGARIDTKWAHAYTVRAGLVIDFDEYVDTAETVASLRVTEAPA